MYVLYMYIYTINDDMYIRKTIKCLSTASERNRRPVVTCWIHMFKHKYISSLKEMIKIPIMYVLVCTYIHTDIYNNNISHKITSQTFGV